MRKSIYLTLAALSLVSCFKDNRMDHNPDDTMAFSEVNFSDPASAFPEITVASQHYMVGVSKTGRGVSDMSCRMPYKPEILTEINAAQGTAYKALPMEYITIHTDNFSFAKEDFFLTGEIEWKAEDVATLMDSSPADYVIPLALESDDMSNIKEGRDKLIIKLVESDIRFVTAAGEDKDGHVYEPFDPSAPELTEAMLKLSVPNRRDDLEVTVEIAPDLIPDYQASTGNYYSAPPEGAAYIYQDKVKVGRGDLQAPVRLVIDNSKISEKHPGYVIPLRIKSVSMPVTIARDVYFVTMKPVL